MTIVDGDDYVLPEVLAHAMQIMEENDLNRCGFGSFRKGQWEDFIEFENEYTDRLRDCFIHERNYLGSIYRSAL